MANFILIEFRIDDSWMRAGPDKLPLIFKHFTPTHLEHRYEWRGFAFTGYDLRRPIPDTQTTRPEFMVAWLRLSPMLEVMAADILPDGETPAGPGWRRLDESY